MERSGTPDSPVFGAERQKCAIKWKNTAESSMEKRRGSILSKMSINKGRPVFPPVFFSAASLCLTAASLLCLAGCPVPDSQDGVELLEFRTFYTQRVDTQTLTFDSIKAVKLAEGSRCIVFVDVNESAISSGIADSIADEYDTRIYPKITEAFGDYMAAGFDVDGNGKTILFLVDIQDGYSGGGYVAGYFDNTHMLDISSYSNKADMLFIDVNPQIPGSLGFYVNIAHELQHLINYSLHGGNSQELWLNEGLSSAAEYLYGGSHREDRIDYFNNDYRNLQTIARGNNFFVWDGYFEREEGDLLANYATAYLFFQWLRIHGGGNLIYRDISNSEYRDYRAVTRAAKNRISDIRETVDSEIWDRLLSSWMIANLVKASTGLYGYKGEIRPQVGYFKDDTLLYNEFSPGEGIYSYLEGKSFSSRMDSGDHIKYLGISAQGIDTTLPYTGEFLLTYNANPDPGGEDEKGYVLSYSGAENPPADAARTAVPSAGPSSYPIGVHDLRALRAAEGAPSRRTR
jgi:hypothetical protein